jgi:hypothetical protein
VTETVLVRGIVHDVLAALAFCAARLGFEVSIHPAPTFAGLVPAAPDSAMTSSPASAAGRSGSRTRPAIRSNCSGPPANGRAEAESSAIARSRRRLCGHA